MSDPLTLAGPTHAGEYHWSIELNVDCPKCEHCFDANDVPDIWDGHSDSGWPGEKPTKGVKCWCPACKAEFVFDIGGGF